MSQEIVCREIASPLGPLLLGSQLGALRCLEFLDDDPREQQLDRLAVGFGAPVVFGDALVFSGAVRQLDEYFAGKRRSFDLPLQLRGTEFQLKVWRALVEIPYGATRSYRDLAQRIGQPQALRAVGAANGRNPLPIIVPCHRVIAADGSLGGFSSGLWRKRQLLALEAPPFELTAA